MPVPSARIGLMLEKTMAAEPDEFPKGLGKSTSVFLLLIQMFNLSKMAFIVIKASQIYIPVVSFTPNVALIMTYSTLCKYEQQSTKSN